MCSASSGPLDPSVCLLGCLSTRRDLFKCILGDTYSFLHLEERRTAGITLLKLLIHELLNPADTKTHASSRPSLYSASLQDNRPFIRFAGSSHLRPTRHPFVHLKPLILELRFTGPRSLRRYSTYCSLRAFDCRRQLITHLILGMRLCWMKPSLLLVGGGFHTPKYWVSVVSFSIWYGEMRRCPPSTAVSPTKCEPVQHPQPVIFCLALSVFKFRRF